MDMFCVKKFLETHENARGLSYKKIWGWEGSRQNSIARLEKQKNIHLMYAFLPWSLTLPVCVL